jgi:hypothetical protein
MHILDQGIIFDAATAPAHQRTNCFTCPLILPDGRILVAFRYGRTKDDPEENLMMRLSCDGGRTWETVLEGLNPDLDGVHGGWRHGAISILEPGRLIGAFCWFDRSDPARSLANPETQGTLPSRVFIMESADDGRTWTDRREVDTAPFQGIATTGPAMRLAGGVMALPYECWKSYYDTSRGEHHAVLRLSRDGCRSFEPATIVAHDSAANLFYWDQRLTVDPHSGRMIGMFWTHDRAAQRDIHIHIAWGSPDGKEWTAPVDTGIAGQICCPLVLPDGRSLAAYVHRHEPPSLRAIVSEDFGKTWDRSHELVFYESPTGRESGIGGQRDIKDYWNDMMVWSFGHAEARLLLDGDVLIAFYGGSPDAMSMRWVRMR